MLEGNSQVGKQLAEAKIAKMEFYSQLAGKTIANWVTACLDELLDPVQIGNEIAKRFKKAVNDE